MADVQLEHGHFKVANDLGEALIRAKIPGRHKDVMWAAIRLIYGYNQTHRPLSQGLIAHVVGIDRRYVQKIIRDLLKWRMLQRDRTRERRVGVLKVQKDFEKWLTGSTVRAIHCRAVTRQIGVLGHVSVKRVGTRQSDVRGHA